jgi:hypothetical protein
MTLKIKTIRGRGYYYNDVSKRVGGKVKTTSSYVGPVNPKRKRIGVGTILANLLIGSAAFGGMAAMGRLKTRHYTDRPYTNQRAKSLANKALRELYAKYQMDDTHPDKFQASFDRLPQEMKDEVLAGRKAVFDRHQASQPRVKEVPTTKQMTPDMKEFADRLTAHRAKQAARAAAPSAPAGPQAEAVAAPDEGDEGTS